ncbi:hypothetical protein CGJ15_26430, partial [Vibrio parahaemolyticus]
MRVGVKIQQPVLESKGMAIYFLKIQDAMDMRLLRNVVECVTLLLKKMKMVRDAVMRRERVKR